MTLARRFAAGVAALALAATVALSGPAGAASGGVAGGASGGAADAVAGSASPDPAVALAVAQWVTGGGSTALKSLARDFKDLETAANANDLKAIGGSCTELSADVTTAQHYAPIPDATAERSWAAALAQYAQGATDCMSGAATTNVNLIAKSSNEIIAGSNDLNNVTKRLTEIAG